MTGGEMELRLRAALSAVVAAMRTTEAARRMGVEAIAKSDASPVTIADLASQAVVIRTLAKRLAEVEISFDGRILAEESDEALRGPEGEAILERVVAAAKAGDPTIDGAAVLESLRTPRADPTTGPCWTLDPVDGTKGFVRGGQYAIALAWLDHGPRVAVMGCPRLSLKREGPACAEPCDDEGTVAWALEGGAWAACSCSDGSLGDAHALMRSPRRDDTPIRVGLSVEAAHGNADAALEYAARLGPVEAIRLDSAAKYVLLAAGRIDLYLRIPRDAHRAEWVWDHAAGTLIATAAGCVVRDLDGCALDFSVGPTLSRNRGVVAAAPSPTECPNPSPERCPNPSPTKC